MNLAPEYYLPIYYTVVTVLSLLVFSQYGNYTNERFGEAPEQSNTGVILLTLFMVLFLGLRPVSGIYFVDMATYDEAYNVIKGQDFVWASGVESNFIFDNMFRWLASRDLSSTFFFLISAAIYFVGISWACSLLFPKDKLAALLVYLSAFSTFAYATNGIKAGVAASIFLLALAMYEKRQWVWSILLLAVSLGFHHAMILPTVAFAACLVVKNPRIYLIFWVLCLFVSLLRINFFQELLARFINEHGAEYLLGSLGAEGYVKENVMGGFRIDFVLYSIIPMVIGLIALESKKIESKKYVFLLNLYTLTNAVWLLCIYSDFTNRIAYLSWMLYPIVLIYPFLNEEWEGQKYKLFQWAVYGHLAFNLFMELIYW